MKKKANELRKVEIVRNFTKHPAGSVLVKWGNTWVFCTASISDKVPPFLKDSGQGWVTAEYSMLPASTPERKERDVKRLKLDARATEIQRLIGRALRAAVDMKKLGERQITIDCDVLQADGGTRCASITGGMVALRDAVDKLLKEKVIAEDPLVQNVAAVSVGICDGVPTLDLDYVHDSTAEVDLNVVMTDAGRFVELQGCAERKPFGDKDLAAMIALAKKGLKRLFALQKKAVATALVIAGLFLPAAASAGSSWPFVIVRSYGSYLENRAFTDRLFAAQERHPDLVNEIWFFNSGDDFGDPEAFARIAAEGCLPAKATCQKLGIRFSYQQGVTLNHEEDGIRRANVPDDAWMVNSSGRILRGLFCCTSPFAKKISRAKAKAVMAALKPDSYWTDDDLRIGRGEGNPQGCFCARCTKLFSESVGRQFDRVSLVAALVGSRPDPAIRRAWCEFNGKMLGEYAKVYREAADAVSPSIRVCQQAPYAGWAHEGESARPAILSAFAGKVGTGTRPGGGYYSDEHVHGLLPKGVSIARDAARAAKLPYVKQVCYEAENWPHVGALKNPGGMMSECAYMLAVGCDSLALYWGSGINGESDESYDFFFDTLAAWKPFLLGVRDAFRGTTPCGLSHCFGEGRYSTAMWRQPVDVEAVAAVARNGVPMSDALAAPEAWIFMGYSVEALREEEIPEVFSKAVVLDARDFRRLAARFPKLAFTQKVSFKDPPKEVALATALRRAGFERFARHGQVENPKAFIYPQAKDVVPFSTMTADTNACGTCIVPTEFGGKVVLVQDNTFVFAPAWAGPQHMWPGCRRAGILDALDAAVPGGMSVRLLTDGYAVAVVARQSKDGRTAGAFLLNLGTGETPPLELAIRRGAAKSWRVLRPKADMLPAKEVRASTSEVVLQLPPLQSFGVACIVPGN